MDPTSTLKNDVFRPLVGVFIPGAIALAPYMHLAVKHINGVEEFWKAHDAAFVALLVVAVLAAGLILENIGSLIESTEIDRWVRKRHPSAPSDWDRYLKLQLDEKSVGQRYLRTLVTRLKFELPMVPALVLAMLGVIQIQKLDSFLQPLPFTILLVVLGFLVVYMLVEAYLSACGLAKTRQLLIEQFGEKPAALLPKSPEHPTHTNSTIA